MLLSTLPIITKMQKIWAKMPYQSFLFSGDEAENFLQGQLTQDIKALNTDKCLYAAYCNPKGRMFANLLLNTFDDKGILLRLHEAQAGPVIKRLKMFVLRAKVTIAEQPFIFIGMNFAMAKALCDLEKVAVPVAFTTLNNSNWKLCALPNGYFELIVFDADYLTVILKQIDAVESDEAIQALRLTGGHFNVLTETNEVILPQQTPLENWGAISYTKGCYVGQEIIARNKYLGKVKKGLAFTLLKHDEKLPLCSNVNSAEGKLIGKVLECEETADGLLVLAVLSLEEMGKDCYINDVDDSVQFAAVPTNI